MLVLGALHLDFDFTVCSVFHKLPGILGFKRAAIHAYILDSFGLVRVESTSKRSWHNWGWLISTYICTLIHGSETWMCVRVELSCHKYMRVHAYKYYTLKPRDCLRPRARSNWLVKSEWNWDITQTKRAAEIYLAALREGVWLLVLVGTHSEVLDCLSRCPLATEQNSV